MPAGKSIANIIQLDCAWKGRERESIHDMCGTWRHSTATSTPLLRLQKGDVSTGELQEPPSVAFLLEGILNIVMAAGRACK